MGSLKYGDAYIELEDRLLAHVQIVIVQKLMRKESFAMSWMESDEGGTGRCSVWLDPRIPLYFRFDGSRVPAIDDEWVRRLRRSADGPTGLIITDPTGKVEPVARWRRKPAERRGARVLQHA
jgi:hypothetical protein